MLVLTSSMTVRCEVLASSKDTIELKFVVDGHNIPCKNLRVELTLGRQQFVPPIIEGRFAVPEVILKAYASKRSRYKTNLSATISCDDYAVDFTGLYPVRALPGMWTAGISYPTSWFDGPELAPEAGFWVSYLITECNDCDPGTVTWETHDDVAQAVLEGLRKEQPTAEGQRARDIAYALAVFRFNYDENRELLIKQLKSCLARPPNSPEDDVCDGRLVDYLANLYWRGDSRLLQILLDVAERRQDVLDEAGEFYSALLDRRMGVAMEGLLKIPEEKQRLVCKMAYTDDLRFDSPKLARIEANLSALGSDSAKVCLKTIQSTAAQLR